MFIAAVAISESVQRGIDDFVEFLPRLIGLVLILLIGYLIAKVLEKTVSFALSKVGVDRALADGPTGVYVERAMPRTKPSEVVGRIVFWFILIAAIAVGISSLGVRTLDVFLTDVLNYLPNVVAAILIFIAGGALAGWLGNNVPRALGDTPTARLSGTGLPALVMAITVFMVLNQLQIATGIVTITYAALIGAAALGMALAFGFGGRDLASRLLEKAYDRQQEEAEETDRRPTAV